MSKERSVPAADTAQSGRLATQRRFALKVLITYVRDWLCSTSRITVWNNIPRLQTDCLCDRFDPARLLQCAFNLHTFQRFHNSPSPCEYEPARMKMTSLLCSTWKTSHEMISWFVSHRWLHKQFHHFFLTLK